MNEPMYCPIGRPHDPFYDAGVGAVCAWALLKTFEIARTQTSLLLWRPR